MRILITESSSSKDKHHKLVEAQSITVINHDLLSDKSKILLESEKNMYGILIDCGEQNYQGKNENQLIDKLYNRYIYRLTNNKNLLKQVMKKGYADLSNALSVANNLSIYNLLGEEGYIKF